MDQWVIKPSLDASKKSKIPRKPVVMRPATETIPAIMKDSLYAGQHFKYFTCSCFSSLNSRPHPVSYGFPGSQSSLVSHGECSTCPMHQVPGGRGFWCSPWGPSMVLMPVAVRAKLKKAQLCKVRTEANTSIHSKGVTPWSRRPFRNVRLCSEVGMSSPPHPPPPHTSTSTAISDNLNLIAYYNVRNGTYFTFNGLKKKFKYYTKSQSGEWIIL